jgi:hypothetical protein
MDEEIQVLHADTGRFFAWERSSFRMEFRKSPAAARRAALAIDARSFRADDFS